MEARNYMYIKLLFFGLMFSQVVLAEKSSFYIAKIWEEDGYYLRLSPSPIGCSDSARVHAYLASDVSGFSDYGLMLSHAKLLKKTLDIEYVIRGDCLSNETTVTILNMSVIQ